MPAWILTVSKQETTNLTTSRTVLTGHCANILEAVFFYRFIPCCCHAEVLLCQRPQSLKMVDPQYYLPNDIGVSALDCSEAFRLLSPQEKMYAHYMSRAAWYVLHLHTFCQGKTAWSKAFLTSRWLCGYRYGGLAVLLQTSPESANIFVLLQRMFRKQNPAQLQQVASAAGLSDDEYKVSISPRNSCCCSFSKSSFRTCL